MRICQRASSSFDGDDVSAEAIAMQGWSKLSRLQYAGDMGWVMKELGWILFCPYVAVPFGALAVVCVLAAALARWSRPLQEFVPELVGALWLSTNFLWMLDDMLWDGPDNPPPWPQMTPLVADDQHTYDRVQRVATVGFLLAPSVYALALLALSARWLRQRSGALQQALVAMLLSAHVASWCVKDFFWTLELMWPAVAADCATVLTLTAQAAVQSQTGLRGIEYEEVAWFVWVGSNALWIFAELKCADDRTWDWTLRGCAAALDLAALALLAAAGARARSQALAARESIALGGGGAKRPGAAGYKAASV